MVEQQDGASIKARMAIMAFIRKGLQQKQANGYEQPPKWASSRPWITEPTGETCKPCSWIRSLT